MCGGLWRSIFQLSRYVGVLVFSLRSYLGSVFGFGSSWRLRLWLGAFDVLPHVVCAVHTLKSVACAAIFCARASPSDSLVQVACVVIVGGIFGSFLLLLSLSSLERVRLVWRFVCSCFGFFLFSLALLVFAKARFLVKIQVAQCISCDSKSIKIRI